MKKSAKQLTKAALSLLMSLLLVLSGLPMEGLREAYAAPEEIGIIKFFIEMNKVGGEVSSTVLKIDGKKLEGIETLRIISKTPKTLNEMGATMSIEDGLLTVKSSKVKDKDLNILKDGETTIVLVPKQNYTFEGNQDRYTFRMDIPYIEAITAVPIGGEEGKPLQNIVQYTGELLPKPLHLVGSKLSDVDKIYIGGTTVDNSPPTDNIEKTENKIKIKQLPSNASSDNRTIALSKEKNILGTAASIRLIVNYENYIIPIKRYRGLETLKIRPNQGTLERKNRFDIVAYKEDGTLNQSISTDNIQGVFLRDSKGVLIPLELINPKKDSEKSIQVRTPRFTKNEKTGEIFAKVKETNIKVSSLEFDVIVKGKGGEEAVKIKEAQIPAYKLVSGLPTLEITDVKYPIGKSNPAREETVLIIGKEIFGVNKEILGISRVLEPNLTLSDANYYPTDNPKEFIVQYKLDGNPKYDLEYPITKMERRISLEIGPTLKPKRKNEIKGNIDLTGENHYHEKTSDGILFVLPEAVLAGEYDILLKTRTIIEYEENGKTITVEIPDEATYKEKFNYKESPLKPKVDKIEPLWGYYHHYKGKSKPLLIRFTGSGFKARKDETTGEWIYPKVKAYDVSVSPDKEITQLIIKGRQIFENGKDPKLLYGEMEGDEYLVEIHPPNPSSEPLKNLIRKNGTPRQKPEKLLVKFYIENPDQGNGETNVEKKETEFYFKYPYDVETEEDLSKVQPHDLKTYDSENNETETFSSGEDNDIIVKFKVTGGNIDLKNTIITMDGKRLTEKQIKEKGPVNGTTDLFMFKIRVPKGSSGKRTLQVISPTGLMDSIDLNFTETKGPWIDIFPKSGQKGTWIVIDRNIKINSEAWFRPESRVVLTKENQPPIYLKKGDPGFKFINENTIEAQIPDTLTDIGVKYKVTVENPGGIKGNTQIFTLLDVGNSKIKIGSISPDRGNSDVPIKVVITADDKYFWNDKSYDVYFGTKKSGNVTISLDKKKLYAEVPRPPDNVTIDEKGYSVRVTVQNPVGATDSKENGFTYIKPTYQDKNMWIDEVYHKGIFEASAKKTNKGKKGEIFIIKGENFRAKNNAGTFILPIVKFGYSDAKIIDPKPTSFKVDPINPNADAIFTELHVEVPEQPEDAKDGWVTVYVVNQDGGSAKKDRGFKYDKLTPKILSGIFSANRFGLGAVTFVEAQQVYKEGLMVAFGEKSDKRVFKSGGTATPIVFEGDKIGDLRVEYAYPNVMLKYKDENDNWQLVENGIRKLTEENPDRVIFRVPWKKYPIKEKNMPNDLKTKLHDELVSVELDTINKLLKVRRKLGEVLESEFKENNNGTVTVYFKTPYHELNPNSRITLINQDGTDTGGKEKFEFHENVDLPSIEKVEGVERKKELFGTILKEVGVYESDYSDTSDISIIGENLKDIQYVMVGDKKVEWAPHRPEGKKISIHVPKGTEQEVDTLQIIKIVTKAGVASSDNAKEIPSYFKYIYTPSKPVIESIQPNFGPRTGGTNVLITGKGFTDKDNFGKVATGENALKIKIGSESVVARVKERDSEGKIVSIEAVIPPSDLTKEDKKVKIRVINPDKGKSKTEDFTYISQPNIFSRKPAGPPDDKGEQWIKLVGEDFQKGAKLYIGGERRRLSKQPSGKQGKSVFGMGPAEKGLNTFYELIGAQEIQDVKVDDANNVQFNLPKDLDLDDSLQMKVTIINPDGGISKEFSLTAFDTPMIAELAPNQGPVGSLVWIKADARGDSFKFEKPPLTMVHFGGSDIPIPAEVKDAGNILFRVPEKIIRNGKEEKVVPGDYEVTVTNQVKENGKTVNKTSPPMIFRVIDTKDHLELASIDPSRGDVAGGIPATIKVKSGKFSAGDKVFFGSQEVPVEGIHPEGTEIYVRVPKWTGKKIKTGDSVPVTVTVQKPSGASGSLIDGFVYYNTGDSEKVKITAVYKDGVSPRTDKGRAQDVFWIEGNHFVIQTKGSPQKVVYPDVYIGHEKAQILEDYLPSEVKDKRILNKIPIRIPERTKMEEPEGKKPGNPQKGKDENRVDVTVVNPDGSVGMLEKGFEYLEGDESVDADTKKLTASRFGDQIKIESTNIPKDHYVVFGKNAVSPDRFDLGIREQQWTTTHSDIEKVVIKYLGPEKQKENFEIYYQKKDGRLLLMGESTDGGKITLNKPGDRKLVKLNWRNPEYHENTAFAQNPALLNKLNDEYMLMELVKTKGNDMVTLQVYRGIGKTDNVKTVPVNGNTNKVTTFVTTPYHERAEITNWTMINQDGQRIFDGKVEKDLQIEFTEPVTGTIEITDIEGSELKQTNIDGKKVNAKIKTVDMRQPAIIKILGKGFNLVGGNTQGSGGQVIRVEGNVNAATARTEGGAKGADIRVKIAGKDAKVLEVGEKGDYLLVEVAAVDEKERAAIKDKPVSVDIHSKNGNAFSSKATPPIYLMFTQPGSSPVIDKIDPEKGPRTGGTRVTITGKGFRDLDSVGVQGSVKYSLDGEKALPVTKVVKDAKGDITALEIVMPAKKTGKSKLQIINADGGTSAMKEFQYISQPQIASVSVKGNDLIIRGTDFQKDPTVYMGAKLQIGGKKPAQSEKEGMLGVENGKNRPAYVIGGRSYKANYVSDNEVVVKLNEKDSQKTADELMKELLKDIQNTSILLLNGDGGVSEPSGKASEALIPEVPVITASPGAEGSVVLSWKVDQETLNKAKKFEIYAKRSGDSEYTFVGDTMQSKTNQAFIVKGLEHDQNYDFKVRVLNDAGEAKDFGTVRGFTLSAADDYKEKEKQQEVDRAVKKIETEGKQEIVGNTVRYTVGIGESVIDLSKHTKYKDKQVQIPIREVQNQRGKTLHIIDGSMNLRMSYASLSAPEFAAVSKDALVRINISSSDSKKEGALRKAIGRNRSRLSPIYKVDFEVVDPKKTQKIKQLSGQVNIGIASSQGQAAYVATYVEAEDKFQKLPNAAISKGGYYVLLKDKN